jgi:hypothetical protein
VDNDWDEDGFGWLPIALLVAGFTMGVLYLAAV